MIKEELEAIKVERQAWMDTDGPDLDRAVPLIVETIPKLLAEVESLQQIVDYHRKACAATETKE